MARNGRIWFEGAKYHVTSRGIRRSSLFFDDEDYQKYLSLLEATMYKHPFKLHSFCLMTNHTHLQIETMKTPLSTIMKKLNTNYAKYINKKYEFTGHVFEKRYGAELLNSPEYEIDVSKYIHLNPVEAGMVNAPEDYPWSSYRAFIYGAKIPLVDPKYILSYFPEPPSQHYQRFMKLTPMDKLYWKDGKLFTVKDGGIPCGQK
ncbi:transposase [Neobacillus mesonae]|uniref:transposase n=1 Tax=Neobacillus mesonae TaxID=1193713 RepID=UPI00257477E6|nr:transposase [Neobacillus mesonae]